LVGQHKTYDAEILVVDDEPIVLKLHGHFASPGGLRRRRGSWWRRSAARFQEEQIHGQTASDDVVMTEITGPKLALDLLQLKPDLKILFMSGCCDFHPNALQRCNCIAKPFTIKDLVKSVDQLANPPVRQDYLDAMFVSIYAGSKAQPPIEPVYVTPSTNLLQSPEMFSA